MSIDDTVVAVLQHCIHRPAVLVSSNAIVVDTWNISADCIEISEIRASEFVG